MIYDAQEFGRVWKPMLVISAAAWAVLLLRPSAVHPLFRCAASPPSFRELLTPDALAPLGASWMLMLVAMMAPALIAPIYHIRLRSFRHRCGRSVVIFVVGYTVVWTGLGALLILLELAVKAFRPQGYVVFAGALVTAIWQFSPAKQRCLNGCHAHPVLAAFGTRADIDTFRFGSTQGLWCAGSCWALMLFPMLLTRGHVVVMAVAAAVISSERLEQAKRPSWAWRGMGRVVRVLAAQMHLHLIGRPNASAHSFPWAKVHHNRRVQTT